MTLPDTLSHKVRRGMLPLGRNTGIWAGCFEFRCPKSVKRKSYGESASRQDSGAFPELGVLTKS